MTNSDEGKAYMDLVSRSGSSDSSSSTVGSQQLS